MEGDLITDLRTYCVLWHFGCLISFFFFFQITVKFAVAFVVGKCGCPSNKSVA